MNDKPTAKHTPGPYTVGTFRKAGLTRSVVINPVGVLTSFTRSDAALGDNARLFAAAPDLLAALDRTVGELVYAAEKLPHSNAKEALRIVRSAIAIAKA